MRLGFRRREGRAVSCPEVPIPVAAVVLVAAALHASWNALVKSVEDRIGVTAVMGLTCLAICGPAALVVAAPDSRSWPAIAGSILLQTLYYLLLIESYRDGDYNQVYPVARGLAPPVVAIASVLFVGESLSAVQAGGVLCVSAGLLVMAAGAQHESRRALTFAAMTGLVIAAYTVVDGVGVRASGSVLGYAAWLFTGEGMMMVAVLVVARRRGARRRHREPGMVGPGVVAGALSLAAYTLVLWGQSHGQLAVVAALRETSVVFAAILGASLFHEQLPTRRILASLVIAAGAAALALG